MKVVEIRPLIKKSKKKNSPPNYSSWDPFTQAKFLFDLHQQVGPKVTMKDAYALAVKAVSKV